MQQLNRWSAGLAATVCVVMLSANDAAGMGKVTPPEEGGGYSASVQAGGYSAKALSASASNQFNSLASGDVSIFTGSASYSISLPVPPGRMGIQPNLSLQYSSGGTETYGGVGWDIGGLPTIRRLVKDGLPNYLPPGQASSGGIRDRFVYGEGAGGGELVFHADSNFPSGGYWTAKVEKEFARFTHVPQANQWTRTDRDGTRTLFSRILPVGANIYGPSTTDGTFLWHAVATIDNRGNRMDFVWNVELDTTLKTWEAYPERIDYTTFEGTGGGGSNGGVQPPKFHVYFRWEARPTPTSSGALVAGSPVTAAGGGLFAYRRRLQQVIAAFQNTQAYRYIFYYVQSPITGRSLLSHVAQIGANGEVHPLTLYPGQNTAVPTPSPLPPVTLAAPATSTAIPRPMRMDYVGRTSTSSVVAEYHASAAAAPPSELGTNEFLLPADVDGDGRQDLVGYNTVAPPCRCAVGDCHHGSHAWHVARIRPNSQGTPTIAWEQWAMTNGSGAPHLDFLVTGCPLSVDPSAGGSVNVHSGFATGRFHRTAVSDVIFFDRISLTLYLGTSVYNTSSPPSQSSAGSFTFAQLPSTGPVNFIDTANISTGNFTGDGSDCLVIDQGGSIVVGVQEKNQSGGNPTGLMHFSTWAQTSALVEPHSFGDFDGDGRTDVLLYSPCSGSFALMRSTGTSFAAPVPFGVGLTSGPDSFVADATDCTTSPPRWLGRILPVDVNADGRTDVVYVTNSNHWFAALSVGDRLARTASGTAIWARMFPSGVAEPSSHPGQTSLGDFNGDGRTDVFAQGGGGAIYLNTGDTQSDGFMHPPAMLSIPGFSGTQAWVYMTDANGDAKTDAVYAHSGGMTVGLINPQFNDNLSSATNGQGKETSFSYDISPATQAVSGRVPFVPQTVSSRSVAIGAGAPVATSAYFYEDSYYDFPTREFRGFERVTTTKPSQGSSGSIVEGGQTVTTFEAKDEWQKGLPLRVQDRKPPSGGAPGAIVRETENSYANMSRGDGSKFPALARYEVTDFDPVGTAPSRSREECYTYDNRGNRTGVIHRGDQSLSWIETFDYHNVVGGAPGPYLIGKLKNRQRRVMPQTGQGGQGQQPQTCPQIQDPPGGGNPGNLVDEESIAYDQATVGASVQQNRVQNFNTAPTFGTMTARERRGDLSSQGNIGTSPNSVNPREVFVPDEFGNIVEQIDPDANRTLEPVEQVVQTHKASTTNALGETTSFAYDFRFGKVQETVGPSGDHTLTHLDGLGRVDYEVRSQDYATNPSGYSSTPDVVPHTADTSFSFSGSALDPWRVTRVERVESVAQAQVRTTHEFYNGDGKLVQRQVPTGNAAGLPYRGTEHLVYNVLGQVHEVRNPWFMPATGNGQAGFGEFESTMFGGVRLSLRYETLGRPSQRMTTLEAGQVGVQNFTYRPWQIESAWGPTGGDTKQHKVIRDFDAYENQVRSTEFNISQGIQTDYEYDARKLLTKVILPGSSGSRPQITFEYDPLGRRTRDVHPDTGEKQYDYDLNGNLVQRRKNPGTADSEISSWTYDPLNRQTIKVDSLGQGGQRGVPGAAQAWVYYTDPSATPSTHLFPATLGSGGTNGVGQLRSVTAQYTNTESVVTRNDSYDLERRVTGLTQVVAMPSVGVGSVTKVFQQTWTDLGLPKTSVNPAGHVHAWEYNDAGQDRRVQVDTGSGPQTIVGGPTAPSALEYDVFGNLKTMRHGNMVEVAENYDAASGRLSSQAVVDLTASAQRLSLGYTWDKVSNPVAISRTDPLGSGSVTYAFDDLNRLTSAQNGSVNESYVYDTQGHGNMVQRNMSGSNGGGGTTIAMTHDSTKVHQLATSTRTGEGTRLYGFDAHGNMVSRGTFNPCAIQWNYDDQPVFMVGLDCPVTSGRLVYDGNGARVVKATVPGDTVLYVTKGFEERQGGAERIEYVTLSSGRAVAKVVTVGTTTTVQQLHQDHLGGVALATGDVSGGAAAVLETARYLPYGEAEADTATGVTQRKFTGQELDAELELYNYGARLYDPEICRFISADPVPDVRRATGQNPYAYVRWNPVRLVDPSGRVPDRPGATPGPFVVDLKPAPVNISPPKGIFNAIAESTTVAAQATLEPKPTASMGDIVIAAAAGSIAAKAEGGPLSNLAIPAQQMVERAIEREDAVKGAKTAVAGAKEIKQMGTNEPKPDKEKPTEKK